MEKETRYFINIGEYENRGWVYTNPNSEEDSGELYLFAPYDEFGNYHDKTDFIKISKTEYDIVAGYIKKGKTDSYEFELLTGNMIKKLTEGRFDTKKKKSLSL